MNKNRRTLIVIAAGIVVVLASLTVWAITRNTDQSPSQEEQQKAQEEKKAAELRESLHEEEGVDFEPGQEPLIVNGETIDIPSIQQKAIPAAQAAAAGYVQQSKRESRTQRYERLAGVFHPTSPAIYDEPPAVDPTYSPNTTSTPTVLYTRWHLEEDYVVVTVAMKITTTDNDTPGRVISEIYQAWDVRVVVNGGVYSAYIISYNKTPIVVDNN